jgi:DMSO/TMAO reductase YedYZ heme-binding membrane subunit
MKKQKDISLKVILLIFFASFSYSVIRYNVVGDVPWKELPFFILNKVFALNGILLLIFTFSISPLKNLNVSIPPSWTAAKKGLGIAGFISIFFHLVMSLMLFTPAYYGKFFDPSEKLTLNAGLSMLSGLIAFVVLWFYNISFFKTGKNNSLKRIIKSKKFLLLVMPFTALHIFFMGYPGWLKPESWHGGIPPISLVAFSFFVAGYLLNLIGRK